MGNNNVEEQVTRGKNTSKLVCDRGADGPPIVPTDKNNWGLHNRSKIQSSMEIPLRLFDISEK